MDYKEFGFEQFNRERRKFAGRRLGSDRRALTDRRMDERRVRAVPVVANRRRGADRRASDQRREGERRGIEDRRDSAWRLLEGS